MCDFFKGVEQRPGIVLRPLTGTGQDYSPKIMPQDAGQIALSWLQSVGKGATGTPIHTFVKRVSRGI